MVSLSPVPTDQIAVVKAFHALLLQQVDDFTTGNLFITDAEDPPPSASNQRYWGALWPLGGQFDEGVFIGSGAADVREAAGIGVTVYRTSYLDQTGQVSEAFLGNDPQALLRLKQKILTVCGQQLYWEQQPLLTELIAPIRSDHPRNRTSESGRKSDIYIEFAVPFTWNLTTIG